MLLFNEGVVLVGKVMCCVGRQSDDDDDDDDGEMECAQNLRKQWRVCAPLPRMAKKAGRCRGRRTKSVETRLQFLQ